MSSKKYFESDDEFDEFEVLVPDRKEKKKERKTQDEEESERERAEKSSDEEESGDDLVGSESDSEPEAMGFGESKEAALKRAKQAVRQIQSDKDKLKLKRKQRDELFKLQKQQKLKALEEKKLPEDFLAEVTTPQSKPKAEDSAEDPDDDSEESNAEDRLHGTDSDRPQSDGDEEQDFLSLSGQTSVKAVYAGKVEKTKSSSAKAADFRQNWLYGNRLKRQTVKEMNAIKEKRSMLRSNLGPYK